LKGLERNPDLIAVDAGSTDPGPYYLGAGKPFTDKAFVKRDLSFMLAAAVDRKIPVVIGTSGGSGASVHLEWCRQIVLEIAKEKGLSFKLGIIPSDIKKDVVKQAIRQNKITPLENVHVLTEEMVEETSYIVGQIGIEPIISALKSGCDVILTGRCYDPAVFAALPVMKGFDEGLALHMGKILECAAIAATPGSGADCALGTLKKNSFILEALNPKRKFTCESAAAHTLYEKSDPYHLPGPGGIINLENCSFEDLPEGRVEVKGSSFVPDNCYRIKLEGARPVGFRSICIAGTRDPIMISEIDRVLQEVKSQINEMTAEQDDSKKLAFHVYGKNGVMGALEPEEKSRAHELCVVIEALCATQGQADTLCSVARSTLLHYGYDGRISTAGNLAFPFSPSDISMGQVFEFSIYHLMELENQDFFTAKIEDVKED
jgi:hypothetical protein